MNRVRFSGRRSPVRSTYANTLFEPWPTISKSPLGAHWRFYNASSPVYSATLIVAHLTYQKWKQLLRKDCIARDKLPAFNTLDEIVLTILYKNGTEPTVDALITKGLPGPPKKAATQSQPGDSQGQAGD